MATLNPSALRENLVRSWEEFVRIQFGALFPNRISYGTPGYVEENEPEWIEVYLLGPAAMGPTRGQESPVLSSTPVGARGRRVRYMPQVNIFARYNPATPYRLYALRDAVARVLCEHATIPVTDYVGGRGVLGALVIRNPNMDAQPTGLLREEVQQWSYAVNADWIETWQS